jgi:hypothetical protein
MSFTLCVLLWALPGRARALGRYEDRVLELLADHNATLLQRVRSDGANDHPLEVQLFAFPSEREFDAYMSDPRRLELAAERDAAVARTEIMRVNQV